MSAKSTAQQIALIQGLPAGLTSRAATRDDLTVVTSLINTEHIADIGTPVTEECNVLNDWEKPNFDIALDTQLALTDNGFS